MFRGYIVKIRGIKKKEGEGEGRGGRGKEKYRA